GSGRLDILLEGCSLGSIIGPVIFKVGINAGLIRLPVVHHLGRLGTSHKCAHQCANCQCTHSAAIARTADQVPNTKYLEHRHLLQARSGLPGALLYALHQAIHGFAYRQVEYLSVQCGVVASGAAEPYHLAVRQTVFASAGRRVNDLGSRYVDDINVDLGIGNLLFTASENAKQLASAGHFPAESGHIASDDIARALNTDGLLIEASF